MGVGSILAGLIVAALSGCADDTGSNPVGSVVVPAQVAADVMQGVLAADRTVYARDVITRMVVEEKVIKASEYWHDDQALPLPAQVFRLGAEQVADQDLDVWYSLLSLWPINQQNRPKTELEKTGLEFIRDNPGENFYGVEDLGGKDYFTAIYEDNGVAQACVTCHNEHKDSPRRDFELNDNMGGLVIRFLLDG